MSAGHATESEVASEPTTAAIPENSQSTKTKQVTEEGTTTVTSLHFICSILFCYNNKSLCFNTAVICVIIKLKQLPLLRRPQGNVHFLLLPIKTKVPSLLASLMSQRKRTRELTSTTPLMAVPQRDNVWIKQVSASLIFFFFFQPRSITEHALC